MIYEWTCPECGNIQTFTAPIEVGPPEQMICEECNIPMNRQYTTAVKFVGEFPGKAIKIERSGENPDAKEILEKKQAAKKETQEFQNEILAERRKGRQHWREYRKRHRSKVEKYNENLSKGVRGE